MVTLIIGDGTAGHLRQSTRDAVTVVCSRRRVLRTPRTGRSRGSMDVFVEAIAQVGASAVVLAGDADGALRRAARAMNCEVLRLPSDHAAAAWVVSIGAALVRADRAALLRVLHVLCNGPDATPGPRRQWNDRVVPALRPTTLARWATRNWSQCGWCRGGGLPGFPCCGCGLMIGGAIVEVIS